MKSPRWFSAFVTAAFLCVYAALPALTASPATSPAHTRSHAPTGVARLGRASGAATDPSASADTATIPGPVRSFLRMAGLSQKVSPEEVLPLFARNVAAMGYPDTRNKPGKPSEYLLLLRRYLVQARELQALAGPQGIIQISRCTDAQPLLDIIGYRLRQACGPATALETADADRAFLTIDSGFPLADLEETLRGGKPFSYPFAATPVPVLYTANEWVTNEKNLKGFPKNSGDPSSQVLDALLNDPLKARLYWSLAHMDNETRAALRQSPGLQRLGPDAGILDFYGGHIAVRSGRVVVPGGAVAEPAWKTLVGASPDAPGEFISRLIAKDDGWLAVYFDALAASNRGQQAYFTKPARLQRFYEAFRGRDISGNPAMHSFRPNPDLYLLVTRLEIDARDEPSVPGNLDAWKQVFQYKEGSKLAKEWAGRAKGWNNPDQLVEGLLALSRLSSLDNPLRIYLALSEIDRGRSPQDRLTPDTVRLLGAKFPVYSSQYPIFSEFRDLNNASITRFIAAAVAVDRISDRILRADTLGIFQANIGLWQILARQGQIPDGLRNDSWQRVVAPFTSIGSEVQLLDAGRTSLETICQAAAGGRSRLSQNELIAVLAGPNQSTPEGQQVHQELATRMRSVLDDQRLVSLDTLLALDRDLHQLAQGKFAGAPSDLIPLAGELQEFEMPRPIFTTRERTEWSAGLYNVRHTTSQMRTNLARLIETGASPDALDGARGEITPFLRDTLVGLNYAYYEPPGAQMLHNNPLFVRSHDFSGQTSANDQSWRAPMVSGRGGTVIGGVHLAGSLADLPYVLADVEQDFIVPENVQSLIWEDFVPGLLSSAVLPRWWSTSPHELHAVALYQRTGEELLTASAGNEKLRDMVMDILSERTGPQRSEEIVRALEAGRTQELLPQMMPSETFFLAAEFRRRFPDNRDAWGAAGKELDDLSREYPDEVGWERLSRDFGVPHPALAQSYALELMNVQPFPTFMGYSSRLLAECWDSNNLYWARLADELGYSPVAMNRLVPELTRRMVEKIAASHPEDWPAVLRAMRETGEEFRQSKTAATPALPSRAQASGDPRLGGSNPVER